MENGLERAEFWKAFLINRCKYPAANKLRDHLANAEFHDFCQCGCNSFAVRIKGSPSPIVAPSDQTGSSAFFTADFELADGKFLEIILIANSQGNLDYIEVECCANSYPVPETIEVDDPSQTWASEAILK